LKEKGSMIVHSDTTEKKHIIKAAPNSEVTEKAVHRSFLLISPVAPPYVNE
jgi:hypothetical protein